MTRRLTDWRGLEMVLEIMERFFDFTKGKEQHDSDYAIEIACGAFCGGT